MIHAPLLPQLSQNKKKKKTTQCVFLGGVELYCAGLFLDISCPVCCQLLFLDALALFLWLDYQITVVFATRQRYYRRYDVSGGYVSHVNAGSERTGCIALMKHVLWRLFIFAFNYEMVSLHSKLLI